ncbi:hypothetical protein K1T71_001527 [Dendrolimus kikuchii]|uniref:Uncharacterized protein n=1 Tax=Dendrolimus kikuchii TaxID=765133 RepID=A0ACC1DI34_9NEOP|nr:hypothetical protein K1T71_001527 [Dendrolimus kikuchii]
MTSRSKNAVRGFETEIEKSREESNWKKAIELALQLKARSPQHESLAHFLIGEGKLEAHLDEWPPNKENIERAQRELSEARGYLTLATDEAGKRAGVALDAHLLLGKLNFACGSYDVALSHYKLAELNTLTEKELPHGTTVLCLICTITTTPGTTTATPEFSLYFDTDIYNIRFINLKKIMCGLATELECIRSFELASELTLLYLQRTSAAGARAGPTLETALQRVPILHIRGGRLQNAIDRYREMLTAVESVSTQALRLTLTRQLAEVLMRGVTGQQMNEFAWLGCARSRDGRYTANIVRRMNLAPSLNGALGSSVWNAGVRAHAVMRRAAPLSPRDAPLRLVGANTCYNMGWIEEGIEMAEEALSIEEDKNGPMLGRCCLYCGIGYQMKAALATGKALLTLSAGVYRIERALSEGASSLSAPRARAPLPEHRAHAWLLLADACLRLGRVSAAAGCVSEAAALTPFSHLVLYTRGLVHASSEEWDEARQCFQNALAIHPTHIDSMVQLGAAYYNLGWLGLAEKALREAAALEPARADTWRRLALVLNLIPPQLCPPDLPTSQIATSYTIVNRSIEFVQTICK